MGGIYKEIKMKRKSIVDTLQFYFETEEHCSPEDAALSAENVLTLMERCGMTPPPFFVDGEEFTHWEQDDNYCGAV